MRQGDNRDEKKMLEKLYKGTRLLQARPEPQNTVYPGVYAGGVPDPQYGMLP